ncbi:MAG: hypothetical protein KUG67_00375 [Proteobacteria bacterium]|nr:hypothetical protein [Pseudomonadota bacterium]
MNSSSNELNRPISIRVVTIIAFIFGLLTIKSGGSVLFIDGPDRVAAGTYTPFVLWFNFIAGFFYLLAAVGLFLQKTWAAWLAIVIVAATLITFTVFSLHISNGGIYESRTIYAMALRSLVWAAIALFAYRKFIHNRQ